MTKPRTLFGRFALAMLGPGPSLERLASLANLNPTSLAVVPIDKSRWKLGCWLACLLYCIFGFAALTYMAWWQGAILLVPLWSACVIFPLFLVLQPVLVATCKQPPLVLEAEGLRVNFAGGFIRYDQITKVTFSYLNGAGKLALQLVPGVKFKSNWATYRLFGYLNFMALYTVSVSDLAGEIERRMKIAASKAASPETLTGANT